MKKIAALFLFFLFVTFGAFANAGDGDPILEGGTAPLTGKLRIEEATDATLDVAAVTHYGGIVVNGDADALEVNLDAAVARMSILILDGAGGAITVDPNGTDTIVYDGTTGSAGEAFISSGAKGDYLALVCVTANQWIVLGHDSNGWTEETP